VQLFPIQPDAHSSVGREQRVGRRHHPEFGARFEPQEDEEIAAAVLHDIHAGGKIRRLGSDDRDVVRADTEDGVG
jgi:hypothetical protein